MERNEIIICRICSKRFNNDGHIVPANTVRELTETLFIELEYIPNEKYICLTCVEQIREAFSFKTLCLNTEESLLPYYNSCNDTNEEFNYVSNNDVNMTICRLCKYALDGTEAAATLTEILEEYQLQEIFQKHIPELDLLVTKNPLICEVCFNLLLNFQSLLRQLNIRKKKETLIEKSYIKSELAPTVVKKCKILYISKRKTMPSLTMDDQTTSKLKSSTDVNSSGNSRHTVIKKIAKTAVQRQQEYRQRKRDKAAASNSENLQSIKKVPKTAVQRQQEYRQRQKNKEEAVNFENQQSTKKIAKTNLQRQREYRQRKKIKALASNSHNMQSIKKLPKTTAQRQKEYRQRQKINQLEASTQQKPALRIKEYRDRLKRSQLDDLLTKKEENVSQIEKKIKLENVQDEVRDKLIVTDDAIPVNRTQQSIQRLNDNTHNKNYSFHAPYEQHNDCVMPNSILRRYTDIPTDGNCLFFSLIKVLRLQIVPKDLRKQLLDSTYLPTCLNPCNARSILSSESEYADLDCIFVFSREYNQNVCVHFYYFNDNTNKEEVWFCHFIVNNSQNFIHLHLTDQHFTPYVEIQQIVDNKIDSQEMEDLPLETFLKVEIDDTAVETKVKIDGATDENYLASAVNQEVRIPVYTNYYEHSSGHLDFYTDFKLNTFGHACVVCDRLWWKKELKKTSDKHEHLLQTILPNYVCGTTVDVCSTCKAALDKQKIPSLSVYNGFSYPVIPSDLPTLNLIEQRLISPRIPFTQIRRLRHVNGQCGIYGQIINVPVEVNTMVNQLPRNIEDDHCFYVHLKKKLIHKTSYVHGLINKRNVEEWLTYLVQTPLYIHHNIKINNAFLNKEEITAELLMDDVSEHMTFEDKLTAQQQTLMWNEDRFFHIALGEKSAPFSILVDEHAEELSFPTIYGGQYRTYSDEIHVTPFMQAASEIRRTDRRGTDPQHLLYLAAKIMKQRVSQSVSMGFKHIGHDTKITKEDVQSENYIDNCIETNLAFLRCIPNSAWYWSDRKKDLFAMIRQLGSPTAFMTLSANETEWEDLLKLLYQLKNNGADVSDDFLTEMSDVHKAQLISDDAITCAIYFNKLVNCLLKILQAKKRSPFGKYRVIHYFKRIEFQHRGSPDAHILLWLDNSPKDLLNNSEEVIQMIDELVDVSQSEASGNIKLQTHKHTFTCYKKMDNIKRENCRFGAPFMPTKKTITLLPMKDSDPDYSEEIFKQYKQHYKLIKTNLENFDYADFDHFYAQNNIVSDEHYYNILRAGINRPKLFYRRTPTEKWFNSFNPFVLHHFKSNMDFQIIPDKYACAAYVVEYVNKHNRGISDLQRQIIEIMNENPEFDILDITKKMSIDILRSVEMPVQEAAWYLLREPMAESSTVIFYIPTVYPNERQTDCTDISKENWFGRYEKRPDYINNVTLAQFVAKYYIKNKGGYTERETPKVIRYHNYKVAENFNDYRREMVLLHIPFRSEENDVLVENKFIQIYEDNRDLILERRKEFESNFDIEKTFEFYRQLCKENDGEYED